MCARFVMLASTLINNLVGSDLQSLHWNRAHKTECQQLRAVSGPVDNKVSLTQVQKGLQKKKK